MKKTLKQTRKLLIPARSMLYILLRKKREKGLFSPNYIILALIPIQTFLMNNNRYFTMKPKKCPKCDSEKIKIIIYLGIKCIKCGNCGYDESAQLEVYPSQKSSQKAKGA